MSQATHHIYKGFSVRFDELEPQNSITMSRATWNALEQLENGSEEFVSQRHQVKAKPKGANGAHELESTYASEHEAKARARTLKEAGYDVEIVPPVIDEPVGLGTEPVPVETVPLETVPDYPVPEDAQHEWLRKEQEAKEQPTPAA